MSSSRADSHALAATTTRSGIDALFAARGLVDVQHRFCLPIRATTISRAMALAIIVSRPVFCAGGIITWLELKFDALRATAPALRAVVARIATVERLGQNRQPRRNASNVQLVAGLLDERFGAARLRRRHENSVGRIGNILLRSEDADVRFNLVVVRAQVLRR